MIKELQDKWAKVETMSWPEKSQDYLVLRTHPKEPTIEKKGTPGANI